MTITDGEGAVSQGPMIPVHGTPNEGRARAVVRLLEAHAIPAILDSDFADTVFPFATPSKPDSIDVLVPYEMLGAAREVLATHAARFEATRPPQPSAPVSTQPLFDVVDDDDDDDDDDDFGPGPLDVVLPEPSPMNGRLSLAVAAIAAGTAMQRALETLWGPGRVRAELAVQWDRMLIEPWRLVSAGFVHGGLSHFISNAMFGVMIGVVLFGTHYIGATALVWLFSSAVGFFMEALLSPEAWIVGASAGNYGLVGLWTHGQLQRSRVSTLPRRERMRTAGVLLLLIPGALTPFSSTGTKIAIMAHAAGYVAGFLAGYVFERRLLDEDSERIQERSRVAGVTAAILVFAAVVAFVNR